MERTEEEPTRNIENEDSFTSIHWLWAHISSQLIYFVLLQYASFPNIVSTLHEKVKNIVLLVDKPCRPASKFEISFKFRFV